MKKGIIKIILCLIFGTVAFLVNIQWLKIVLFFMSYLSIGYEIILEALEGIKDKELWRRVLNEHCKLWSLCNR